MDRESRARSSHYLLLFGACKLPENGLGYRGGGLDCEGVHEHVRCRCHFGLDPQPAGCQFDATPAKLNATLYENVGLWFLGLKGSSSNEGICANFESKLVSAHLGFDRAD